MTQTDVVGKHLLSGTGTPVPPEMTDWTSDHHEQMYSQKDSDYIQNLNRTLCQWGSYQWEM